MNENDKQAGPVAFYYRTGLIRAGYGIEIKDGTPLYIHPPAETAQKPYLWMTEWWVQGGPDNGEYEYETNFSNEFSCGRKDGFSLYRHPAQPVQPAVAVNQQELCPSCRNADIYACTCPFKTARNSQPECFEPASLVRLTDEDLLNILHKTKDTLLPFEHGALLFGRAIMDAMIKKNGGKHD